MIQYDTNGATLFYIDSNNQRVSKNPLDGDAYYNLVVIKEAQDAARDRNTQVVAQYKTELANAQTNVDAGRPPALVPMPPSEKVVDDQGNTTYKAFAPPLPVLVPLNTVPTGSLVAQGTPDKLGLIFNMVKAIYNKTFPQG